MSQRNDALQGMIDAAIDWHQARRDFHGTTHNLTRLPRLGICERALADAISRYRKTMVDTALADERDQ